VRLLLPRDGAAAILAGLGAQPATPEAYEALRLSLGVPAGSRDVEVEKSTLLEAGFDELHGISWDKGCYMGQELTARTKYRGLVKRRLVPVRIDGPLPAPGTPVTGADGKVVGEVRGGGDGRAMALLRLEALEADGLTAGEARLAPERPAWAGW
jgi:folate-binding protein YgfZ